jgi:hypothetical protein
METIYKGKGPAERIADRLRNSGGDHADHVIRHGGDAPNRTITNIHHYRSNHNHGVPSRGERDKREEGGNRG